MAGVRENLFILTPLNFKEEKANFEEKNANINENVERYDPLIFCRTCASIDSCFVPIFKDEGMLYELNNKIAKYLPIKISEKDDLPVQICYHCASTIIAWDNLLVGCVEAEKKLKLLKNSLQNKEGKEVQESIKDELGIECVDSDDEPLIAKKTGEILIKIEEKRDILQEKNDLQTLEPLEVESERRPRRIPARSNRKISSHGNEIHDENIKNSKKCSECGESVFRSLKKHMKIHHPRNRKLVSENASRKCPICRKSHRDVEELAEDLYSHVVNDLAEGSDKWNPNVCKICNKTYELIELPDHILLHIDPEKKENRKVRKKQIVEEEGKLKCEICGKSISKKYAMKRHLATHSGEKKYTCHHCGKQYAQESGLQRHVLVIHKGVRKYKCPICSAVFGSNSDLKLHQDTHTDPRPFQCDQCGRTFISQKHLYHHRKYHHTANGMRQLCNICNRYFSSPSVLRRHHKVVHLGLKQFQCHVCSAQLSTKHYLQEHLRLHSDERPEVCSFCGKTFQVTGNLRQHLKTHMGKTQVCYVCGKGFTRRCHLLIHMGSHRGLEHPQCEHCNQIFVLKSDFEKHMKKEHGEKISGVDSVGVEKKNPPLVLSPDSSDQFIDNLEDSSVGLESHYSRFEELDQIAKLPKEKVESKTATREKRFFKCDICKKIFNRRYNFERHLLVHSGETLTCHTCGKQYRRQSVLDRHIKVVHQQMRLANLCCNYCSKVFSSQQSLEDHFRTHTGERPFICEICGKDFRARPNLIAHKKIHTGELPYSCMLCDYRCRLKSTFVDHCQRHEGTRSCLCSICGKGFVNNYDLMKHKKTHSKERRFSCSFCSLTFVMKRYLKVHLKTHAQKLEGVTNLSPVENEAKPTEEGNSDDGLDSEKEFINLSEDYKEDWNLIPKSWLDVISCKYCGKVSSSLKHLRQHEKRGTCTKRFQCNKCDLRFSKEPNLLRHLKTHEKGKRGNEIKKYSCVVCNKKFRFEDNRLAHERICGSATHKCSECGKRFETKTLADQHCISHHKSRVCHMCGQSFGKPESLKQHLKTVHEEFKMVCHYCGKDFTRKARFQEHLQRHTGQMDFTCHICGKGSTNAYAFGVHLATHTKDTPFSCSFCPRTFKHMKYVYLHERSVHLKLKSGKTYVKPKRPGKNAAKRTCPLCGKMFMRESSMLIHKRTVHEGKNGYLCKLCGKDFKYTYLLYVHKKKYHFPELCKYTCSFCKRRFPVKTELKNHLPKHTGEKPYTCDLCGKTYSFHGSLNMHMKMQHQEKKNFKCEFCGSSYSFRSHLQRHARMHERKDLKVVHGLTADECQN